MITYSEFDTYIHGTEPQLFVVRIFFFMAKAITSSEAVFAGTSGVGGLVDDPSDLLGVDIFLHLKMLEGIFRPLPQFGGRVNEECYKMRSLRIVKLFR